MGNIIDFLLFAILNSLIQCGLIINESCSPPRLKSGSFESQLERLKTNTFHSHLYNETFEFLVGRLSKCFNFRFADSPKSRARPEKRKRERELWMSESNQCVNS